MMAIIGMFFQDGLTGSAWGDWANYTDSPLRAFESELGVQAPVGFWDPVGFTKDGDTEDFKRRRVTEIKHGRVSMLATMGYITPELTGKWPGYLSPSADLKFEDIPNGLAAISKVPTAGWVQILLWGLICEGAGGGLDAQLKGEPGDLGWKPPLLATNDAELKTKRLNAELANGRLAMMAIIGMFFQDGLTGSAWGDWSNYTDSPLRAFDTELGATAPFKYWDPLGMSDDGDQEAFRRRREAEIKNGRVAMIASIGWIVPEYFRWPGYLSPSQDLRFEDVPNGMAALSKMPADGWAQIGVFVAFLELFPLRQEKVRMAGDFKTCGKFGIPWFFVAGKEGSTCDPVASERSLNAEINNGRLAMVAITGMVFQNGVTGTTDGPMWFGY